MFPSTSGEQIDKTLENGGHAETGSDNLILILERMVKRNEESELLIEQLKVIICLPHVLKSLILALNFCKCHNAILALKHVLEINYSYHILL